MSAYHCARGELSIIITRRFCLVLTFSLAFSCTCIIGHGRVYDFFPDHSSLSLRRAGLKLVSPSFSFIFVFISFLDLEHLLCFCGIHSAPLKIALYPQWKLPYLARAGLQTLLAAMRAMQRDLQKNIIFQRSVLLLRESRREVL